MRKGLKKSLAIILSLILMLSVSPLAFAQSSKDGPTDWGYQFEGVYRVKQGKSISVPIPKDILDADDIEVYVYDGEIAYVADVYTRNAAIKAEADGWGATVLCFCGYYGVESSEFDWSYDYYVEHNYILFVYDEEDAQLDGQITGFMTTDWDLNVKVGEEGYIGYDFETDGEVFCDTLVYCDGEGIGVDDDGFFYAYDRGSVDGIMYIVDSNGNYFFDTFTITARYTPLQFIMNMIKRVIRIIFGWAFYDY